MGALGWFESIVRWIVTVPADLIWDAAAGPLVGEQVVIHVCRLQFGYPCRRVRFRGVRDGIAGSPRHVGYWIDADAVGDPVLVYDYSSRCSGSHPERAFRFQ